MNEHEFEPVRGLPSTLPDGEHVVWQGSPNWQSLAVRAFHVRKIGIYFALLVSLSLASSLAGNATVVAALPSIKMLLILATAAIGILVILAIAYSNTTIYTVTNRRLVLRFGIAVQLMINIPWEKVNSAGLKEFADGTGDILIETDGSEKMSFWILWPNARPWHLSNAQPLLRSLPDAAAAGASIAKLMQREFNVQNATESQRNRPHSPLATSG
jgi:hypothetical protein